VSRGEGEQQAAHSRHTVSGEEGQQQASGIQL
jgi:hypothetical protein